MRILIIQSKGKHPRNVQFRESLCMKRALERIKGIEPIVWGTGYDNFQIPFKVMSDYTDAILLLENYSKYPWLPDMSDVKKLKLFWSIDSHIVLERHQNMARNHKIDIVLNSTSYYVKHFKNGIWFPNCYPADLISPVNVPKKYDIGFCGNYVNRKKWIDDLSRTFNFKKDIFVIGNDMVKAISSYKIHFNKNHSRDINYRTFETLGCKTLLITNETDKLNKLFILGEHLLTYSSLENCKKIIRRMLANPKRRNRIAEAGYNHVRKNHTYDNRARELVKIIKENI